MKYRIVIRSPLALRRITIEAPTEEMACLLARIDAADAGLKNVTILSISKGAE